MTPSFAKELYEGQFSNVPGALELMSRWENLLENPAFISYMNFERHFEQGLDPMPDRDRFEHLLRAAGHDFAMVEVVPKGSVLASLFGRAPFYQWQFFGLQGLVMARVLPVARALTQVEAELVYSTLDRLLRGGRHWPELTQAPAASRDFYKALQAIRFPGESSLIGILDDIVRPKGVEVAGDHFRNICACIEAAGDVITTSVALKNGHRAVTVDDAVEGAEAVLRLFEVDLHRLPPFQRIGRSGYEL